MPTLKKIQGLLIPADWNAEGEVLAIAIASFDENQFFVELNENSEELFKLIGQSVIVRGFIRIENGKKTGAGSGTFVDFSSIYK